MAKASILVSYLLKQSDIRTFFVKNISKILAFWQARLDPLWAVGVSYLTSIQREMTEDL